MLVKGKGIELMIPLTGKNGNEYLVWGYADGMVFHRVGDSEYVVHVRTNDDDTETRYVVRKNGKEVKTFVDDAPVEVFSVKSSMERIDELLGEIEEKNGSK